MKKLSIRNFSPYGEDDDFSSNTYVVGLKNEPCIIIDAGCFNNSLVEHINHVHGGKVAVIIITHGHFDHINKLSSFYKKYPSTPIYISKKDEPLLSDAYLNGSKSFGMNIIAPVPHLIFEDDDELDVANLEIRFILTPYHTLGSACIYLEEYSVMFSGDSLFAHGGIGRYDLPHADVKKLPTSLKKILSHPDSVIIYPGHGEPTSIEEAKRYLPNL